MPFSRSFAIITAAVVLLCLSILPIFTIQNDSLWLDESWTAATVYDNLTRYPQTTNEWLRFIAEDSLLQTVQRVRDDMHAPLYFVLMDVWTLWLGESEFILRLPSLLMGMVALAATYSIGRVWRCREAGFAAMIVMGTAGFYLYYAREARMYTLYLACITIAILAYSLFWRRATIWRGIVFALAMALALYTHYVALIVIAAIFVHHILTKRTKWLLLPYLGAAIVFVRWLPFAYQQFQTHTGGAWAAYLPSDWNTLAALWLLLTSGYWLNFLLPFVFSHAPHDAVQTSEGRDFALLLFIVGLLPLVMLMVINAQGVTVLQVRYVIHLLPLWALLVGWAIAFTRIPFVNNFYLSVAVALFFLGWLSYTQISMYEDLWEQKPLWRDTAQELADQRPSLEPALTNLPTHSPAAYYHRQMNYAGGIALNFGWRPFAPVEIQRLVEQVENNEGVWLFAPIQDPSTWDAVTALSATRGVSYRYSIDNFLFYRFDSESAQTPFFSIGDALTYESGWQEQAIEQGETLCVPLTFIALNNKDQPLNTTLSVTRGYREVITETTRTVNNLSRGDAIQIEPCVTIPDDTPTETLHLRLIVTENDERLLITERGIAWGDFLLIGTLAVR